MCEPLLEYHKRNWLTQFRIKASGGRLLPIAFLPAQRIVKKLSQVVIQYAHFFYECSQYGAYIKLHKVGEVYVFLDISNYISRANLRDTCHILCRIIFLDQAN